MDEFLWIARSHNWIQDIIFRFSFSRMLENWYDGSMAKKSYPLHSIAVEARHCSIAVFTCLSRSVSTL